MADISLVYQNGVFDLDFGEGGACVDEGLRSAVIVSLFTDRRADPAADLPDGGMDRRGFWGDVAPDVAADRIGSWLWLLGREKQLPGVVRRAEEYARQALQWLIDDGVLTGVTVTGSNPASGVLWLDVRLTDRAGRTTAYRAVIDGTLAYLEQDPPATLRV